ncbi:MAG: T9SS type A sorting domain-containing protein [Bacteroidales bacterium]|nr:T9SS type A sorting domain-containing protein [Bacteroidales bacterium]
MSAHVKKLITVIIVMMAGVAYVNAQNRAYFVNFEYDNDGNRISRTITIGDDREERSSNDTTEVIHYTDILDESQINIYPNPTTKSVFINITNPEEDTMITATLLSPSGVFLETKEISTAPVEFDLSSMAAGVYILELRSGTDKKTWKIIKR